MKSIDYEISDTSIQIISENIKYIFVLKCKRNYEAAY